MSLHKDLTELVKSELITQDTADKILVYYRNRASSFSNRLLVVFGILGAILVGLGIILIVAHNWDQLSRATKTFFAFLPLITGQALCGYTLLRRQDSVPWREGCAAFLFFAVGASIALVSQVYHIPGGTGSFLLTWMSLCLPLIYMMTASITAMLYISGISWYAVHIGFWEYPATQPFAYWLLLAAVLPHVIRQNKKMPDSNFTEFLNWFVPLSLIIALGTMARKTEEFMFVAYVSLFGLFYLSGTDFQSFRNRKPGGLRILGSLGTVVLLLILSYDDFWARLRREQFPLRELVVAPEFIAAVIISALAGWVFFRVHRGKNIADMKPLAPVFLLFIATFIIGLFSSVAVVLINVIVLFAGLLTIRNGARQDHLGILNFGLMIIAAQVACRFFDTEMSFIVRGLLFVCVGAGFFGANRLLLKRRRANAL